jgi:hypothetical protein
MSNGIGIPPLPPQRPGGTHMCGYTEDTNISDVEIVASGPLSLDEVMDFVRSTEPTQENILALFLTTLERGVTDEAKDALIVAIQGVLEFTALLNGFADIFGGGIEVEAF